MVNLDINIMLLINSDSYCLSLKMAMHTLKPFSMTFSSLYILIDIKMFVIIEAWERRLLLMDSSNVNFTA